MEAVSVGLGKQFTARGKKDFFRYKILKYIHLSESLNNFFKTGSPLGMVQFTDVAMSLECGAFNS